MSRHAKCVERCQGNVWECMKYGCHESKFPTPQFVERTYLSAKAKLTGWLEADLAPGHVVVKTDEHKAMVDLLGVVHVKAMAGLCQFTNEGTREFLKDIKRLTAQYDPAASGTLSGGAESQGEKPA